MPLGNCQASGCPLRVDSTNSTERPIGSRAIDGLDGLRMAARGGELPFASGRSVIVTSICIKDNRVPIWPRELRREAAVKANFAPGLHVAPGQSANVSAYDRWIGRWSRMSL